MSDSSGTGGKNSGPRHALGAARDPSGATAVEYGIIAALLSMAIVVTVPEIGVVVTDFFTSVKNSF